MSTTPTIPLIGLGPGDPMLLTRAAHAALAHAEAIYTPAPAHPALQEFRQRVEVATLERFDAWEHTTITNHAHRGARVCCAFPGTPRDWSAKVALLDGYGCHLQQLPGISMLEAFAAALGSTENIAQVVMVADLLNTPAAAFPRPRTSGVAAWCETQGIAAYHPPQAPPPLLTGREALVWGFTRLTHHHDPLELFHVRDTLLHWYPPGHRLHLLCLDTRGEVAHRLDVPLDALHTHEALINQHTALAIPPLAPTENRRTFDGLHVVSTQLLAPGGCPWDTRQTHHSLRPNLLEETHEVLEALDSGDMAALSEELGDLLVQVVIHSEMARQAGHFDIGDVLEHITTKLIRRHPHIFRELPVEGADEVLHNWEQIKAQELAEKGRQRTSALDGVPAGLPALAAAQKSVTKAIRAGFTWRTIAEVWAKLHEEVDELRQASHTHQHTPSEANHRHLSEELGDVLFVVATLARWLDLDAESSLREASARFRRRFVAMEQMLEARGQRFATLSDAEKLALWNEARQAVRNATA